MTAIALPPLVSTQWHFVSSLVHLLRDIADKYHPYPTRTTWACYSTLDIPVGMGKPSGENERLLTRREIEAAAFWSCGLQSRLFIPGQAALEAKAINDPFSTFPTLGGSAGAGQPRGVILAPPKYSCYQRKAG